MVLVLVAVLCALACAAATTSTIAVAVVGAGKKAKEDRGANWKGKMLFSERLIAGSCARGVAQTCLHPIDVARTRLQAKGLTMAWTPRTFIKGITPQFVGAFPAGALQFASYEWAKDRCADAKFGGALSEMLCGAVGALGASIVRVPQEVLKQRVQADIYPNAVAGFSTLMKSEGPRGFYKGYLATISRDVPWNALSFMFFGQAKKAFKNAVGRVPSTEENLGLGAVSGMAAAVIMTPVDVVKTRLMTGGASGGIGQTFKTILKDEGAATLMKGVVPRVMYLAPLAAVTLSLYEAFGKKLVSKRLDIPVLEMH